MADIIQLRRDTAVNWTTADPILADGEIGVEIDTQKVKVGNGSALWSVQPYLIDTGDYLATSDLNDLIGVDIEAYDETILKDADIGVTLAAIGANTFTGTQNLGDNILQKANLLDYGEVTNAIGLTGGGIQSIDLTLGNSVTATVDTSANTFTFDNPTASNELCGFTLLLTNGGSQTVNWPASVVWPDATAPELTVNGVDKLVFETYDGGITWHGNLAGAAYA